MDNRGLLISSYEEEYHYYINQLVSKIAYLRRKRSNLLQKQIEEDFATIDDILSSINIEVTMMSGREKTNGQNKLKSFRNERTQYFNEFEKIILIENDMTHNTLNNALSIAKNTEDIGSSILTNLEEQRQKIDMSSNRLDTANEHLDKSKVIIDKMIRRKMTDKVMKFIIGVGLCLIIGCIIIVIIV